MNTDFLMFSANELDGPSEGEKKSNLVAKSELDRKSDAIIVISDPKYFYFGTVFNFFSKITLTLQK